MENDSELFQLALMQSIIHRSFGFEAAVLEKSSFLSINLLVSSIPNDSYQRVRNVNFTFLPFGSKDTDQVNLLQIFSIIPESLSKGNNSQLQVDDLLHQLNRRTVLGNFIYTEEGEIAFRYVYPVSKRDGVNAPEFSEVFSLFLFLLDMFSHRISKYLGNDITYEDLIAELG